MKKKFLPLIFIVGLVALILFQDKAIMPVVEKIAASDLFLEDSGDEGSRIATTTDMTNYAFMQCNRAIKEELDNETNVIFPSTPLQSWALGNYKYIVNAEIEVATEDGSTFFKKYACHIEYDEEDNLEAVMDADNWTINGISGI